METTIDEVIIEIDSSSASAATGLDNLKNSIDKLYISLDMTLNKLGKFNSALINVQSKVQSSSVSAGAGLDDLKNSIDKLYSSLDMILNKLGKFNSALVNMQSKAQNSAAFNVGSGLNLDVGATNINTSRYDKLAEKTQQISNYTSQARGKVSSLASAFNRVGRAVSSISSKIGNMINFFSKGTKKIKDGFDAITPRSKKFFDGSNVSRGLKKIMKYAFALFSIRGTYALLSSAANRWLSSTNAAAQQLSANIDYLKFAAGSALAPVIEYLVNLVYSLLKGIQKVAYALTGVNIFAKATASSMASTAKSAKEAAKSLAPFDELNVIDFNKSSGGGGGGVGPSLDLSKMDDTTNSILEAIKRGDWYGVGMEIGKKINEALEKIDWNPIKERARQIATNIADLINGFVDGTDWSLVGRTVGEGINTGLIFADTFLTRTNFENIGRSIGELLNSGIKTLDWKLLGKTIADYFNMSIDTAYGFFKEFDFKTLGSSFSQSVNSMFENVEWDKAAQVLSDGIKGVFDFLTGFIKDLDWKQVVDAIGEFVVNIDWGGIVSSIFELLGTAAASLINLGQVIGNYIMEAFNGIGQFFNEAVEACGGDIVQGIFLGILEALRVLGQWIIDNIFKPFIDGFKNAFQIHSPSKVMEELGVNIIQGLFDGVKSLVGNVIQIATDIWNGFTGALSGMANWVNSTIIQPIANFFSQLWNNVTQIAKNIYKGFTGAISNIANWVNSTIIQPVINTFKNLWNTITGIFNNIKNAISTALSNLNIRIKLPHFSWTSTPIGGWIGDVLRALSLPASLPKLNISWYASGGFPKTGEIFAANEAGPEMIGKIGNKTTVANNDQITTAIAKATYEAVSKALFENQENEQQIVINLGNETLYKGMTRNRNQASNQYGITV